MKNEEVLHIVSEIRQGNIEGFAILVETYQHMVYSLCLRMTNSKEDAEEIAQDAFVKAFQGIHKFKGKAKFSTWLYQITYFSLVGYLRKKKIKIIENDQSFDFEDVDENILSKLQQQERQEYIDKAFLYLKPDERAVISLFYLDEFSIKEIANITKLSESNVKVKIHRVKKKLYNILGKLLNNEVHSLI